VDAHYPAELAEEGAEEVGSYLWIEVADIHGSVRIPVLDCEGGYGSSGSGGRHMLVFEKGDWLGRGRWLSRPVAVEDAVVVIDNIY
jgi:hypothetical protein